MAPSSMIAVWLDGRAACMCMYMYLPTSLPTYVPTSMYMYVPTYLPMYVPMHVCTWLDGWASASVANAAAAHRCALTDPLTVATAFVPPPSLSMGPSPSTCRRMPMSGARAPASMIVVWASLLPLPMLARARAAISANFGGASADLGGASADLGGASADLGGVSAEPAVG